jgi:hypothetical protein
MLQLNVSSATNYNAVYPDVSAPIGTNSVILEFTQSYDYSTKGNVVATLLNTVSATNPWLVLSLNGNTLPTASGQYDVNIYKNDGSGIAYQWYNANMTWTNANFLWSQGANPVKGIYLSTERAFISGSNGVTTTTYLLPANGGTYTTYNYP